MERSANYSWQSQPISSLGAEDIPREQQGDSPHKNIPDLDVNCVLVHDILKETECNWFPFVAYLEPKFRSQGYTQEELDQFLVDFASQLQNLGLNDEEFRITEQSRAVYLSEMLAKETRAETVDEEDDEDELAGNEMTYNVDDQKIRWILHQIKYKSRRKAGAEIEASGLFQRRSTDRMDAIDKRHSR